MAQAHYLTWPELEEAYRLSLDVANRPGPAKFILIFAWFAVAIAAWFVLGGNMVDGWAVAGANLVVLALIYRIYFPGFLPLQPPSEPDTQLERRLSFDSAGVKLRVTTLDSDEQRWWAWRDLKLKRSTTTMLLLYDNRYMPLAIPRRVLEPADVELLQTRLQGM